MDELVVWATASLRESVPPVIQQRTLENLAAGGALDSRPGHPTRGLTPSRSPLIPVNPFGKVSPIAGSPIVVYTGPEGGCWTDTAPFRRRRSPRWATPSRSCACGRWPRSPPATSRRRSVRSPRRFFHPTWSCAGWLAFCALAPPRIRRLFPCWKARPQRSGTKRPGSGGDFARSCFRPGQRRQAVRGDSPFPQLRPE